MRPDFFTLVRWSGFAALLGGLIFVAIQPFHPADDITSVGTGAWTAIQTLKLVMCFLFLYGVGGIYLRQAERAGWLGLAGFLALAVFWALQSGFVFLLAFVFPPLAPTSPAFVESVLGIISGAPPTVTLGGLPAIYGAAGGLYLLGGVLFGIATFRAGVLPRGAGVLLVGGALLPLALASFVPHPYDRLFALPVGLGLAWLGQAVFVDRVWAKSTA